MVHFSVKERARKELLAAGDMADDNAAALTRVQALSSLFW
jgi:hypothetical protein